MKQTGVISEVSQNTIKLSFLEAAYNVLKKEGRPLSVSEITSIAISSGLILTKGKTPSATMGAQIYRDMKRRGEGSRFLKVGRGKFGLRVWKQPKASFKEGTFKSVAYNILKSTGKPMTVEEITRFALTQGLLKTVGKTPAATMGAQLYTDIKKKGFKSHFVQLGKNRFGLKEWNLGALEGDIKKAEKEKVVIDKKRSIVGDPINFKGLVYGPTNEDGVIFLFGKIHQELGINVEAIQSAFPDAKGRRKVRKGWEDVWIEFEYKSSDFKVHDHDPKGCDIIVCWEHDWKECPPSLEVIELKSVVQNLKNRWNP